MLSVEDALARLLRRADPVGVESRRRPSMRSGRVLAADVLSQIDVPPQDNSEMDGYALRAADVAGRRAPCCASASGSPPAASARRSSRARRRASSPARRCRPAPMRSSCRSSRSGRRRRARRRCACPAVAHRSGAAAMTSRAGAWSLRAGIRLVPQALGMAASVGAARVQVRAGLRVALFSTGDELAMPGEAAQARARSTTPTASCCAACSQRSAAK